MASTLLNELRKLAGLKALTESYDDDDGDDDLSPAERDLIKKADKDLKAKGIDVDEKPEPKKATEKPAEKPAEKKAEEKKPEPKKAEEKKAAEKPAPKKAEEKKAEEAPAAKRRGKAPSDDSKSGKARAWLKANPSARRKDFIAYMTKEHGMSAHHANTAFYAIKKKSAAAVAEGYILVHPLTSTYVLAENAAMGSYQWIDVTSDLPVVICETQKEAERIVEYMNDHRNQNPKIEFFSLDN